MGFLKKFFPSKASNTLVTSAYKPGQREEGDPELRLPNKPTIRPLDDAGLIEVGNLTEQATEAGLTNATSIEESLAGKGESGDTRLDGIALGNILSEETGFTWATYRDDHGEALILSGDAGSIKGLSLFPLAEAEERRGEKARTVGAFIADTVAMVERYKTY